jgi:hypothetical protein
MWRSYIFVRLRVSCWSRTNSVLLESNYVDFRNKMKSRCHIRVRAVKCRNICNFFFLTFVDIKLFNGIQTKLISDISS